MVRVMEIARDLFFLKSQIFHMYVLIHIKIFKVYFKKINPVQFPLHEPYFDLTPIKITHTKIVLKMETQLIKCSLINKQPNLLHIFLSAPDE
jgi:hypothetical protein